MPEEVSEEDDAKTPSRMPYLIHQVGAGEKAAQDLTYEEAVEAAQLLLSGEATAAQAGGFLVGMRVKGETADETRAFTEVVRDYNKPLLLDKKIAPLDIPVYAGKKTFFHAIIPAAFLLAGLGQPVLLHGYSDAPGRLSAAEVLNALGVCIGFNSQEGAVFLERVGFLYLDVAKFNPALHRFQLLRNELGVRTLFNAVCRMADPAGSGLHWIGISHPPYFETTLETLKPLRSKRIVIVRGVEGGPEPSMTSETQGFLFHDGKTEPITFPIKETGRSWARRADIPGGDASDQADLTKKILSGELSGPARDWTLLTAAYGLLAGGKCRSLIEGWNMAEEGLANKKGAAKLEEVLNS
jgi:anthranilate phosphoribosyltransferase